MNAYEYDDEGEPIVSTADRILRALRFHDWIEPSDLYDQLELAVRSLERRAYQTAMSRLVKSGLIQRRVVSYYDDRSARTQTMTVVKLAANRKAAL